MDARELRIGNWFKTNQEVFNPREQVASKIEAAGHINDYHESFCEPIPLTEEWQRVNSYLSSKHYEKPRIVLA